MSAQEPKSLVFLGSKPIGFKCFEYLISQREALGFTISGLVTQQRREFGDGADLAQLAALYHVPVFQSLQELPPCDILYSVQHHQILKQETIDLARQIAVNLHMAPLPEYRGCNQFSMAILDGKKTFGATIHQIDARIDHGDLLFEERFPIPDECWVQDLYQLTFDASVALFRRSLAALIEGRYELTPQAALEAERGTSLHYRREIASLKEIDLDWDAEKIARHIRATAMPGFEPPYAFVGGRKIYLTPTAHS